MDQKTFIAQLPKAELHLHIEGSLEPEMLLALGERNGVDLPFKTIEEVRQAYAFTRLQDFLDIYYQGMNVLLTEQDYYDLTMAYLRRAHGDAVRHTEIFFDPQGHTDRGVPFATVVDGITDAMRDAETELGISCYLILSILRHLSEEAAFATLAEAEPHLDKFVGVGLDSSELGHPPEKFARVFARAGDMGLKRCAHAGEEGPPDYVRGSLDILQVDRIDHGNRCLEDEALAARITEMGITLTNCPLSNLKLCVIDDMAQSPVRTMLERGMAVTVNSDDPAYFGGYINANYEAAASALGLSNEDLATLAANSFRGSFLPEDAKARHLAAIEGVG